MLVAFAPFVALGAPSERRRGERDRRRQHCLGLGSLVFAIAGWGSPETAGTVWIVLQALVVAGFAELQVASAPWRAGRTS